MKNVNWKPEEAIALLNSKNRFDGGKARIMVYKNNIDIFNQWGYVTDNGKTIEFSDKQQMLDDTIVYRKEYSVDSIGEKFENTIISFHQEECLVGCEGMQGRGLNPAVLNLADAYKACGKYNGGSNAQEESLARQTTLSQCLYQYYNKLWAKKAGVPLRPELGYPMDMNFGGIYSRVTVFRDGPKTGFALRENPFETGIISVAALNFRKKHLKNNIEYQSEDGGFTTEGEVIMRNKIRTIYRAAIEHNHDSIILGGWGCGVFELCSDLVCKLFLTILEESEFKNKFREVRFSIIGADLCKEFAVAAGCEISNN